MNSQEHWDKIYRANEPDAVSWYRPHLDVSLALIDRSGLGPEAAVIDVGGGESTLVDDLLARGYQSITVLDISSAALEVTRRRLGAAAERVRWIAGTSPRSNCPNPLTTSGTTERSSNFLPTPRRASATCAR